MAEPKEPKTEARTIKRAYFADGVYVNGGARTSATVGIEGVKEMRELPHGLEVRGRKNELVPWSHVKSAEYA